MKGTLRAAAALAAIVAPGCIRHEIEVKPIGVEVAPIEITVNVNVRVQKDLEELYGFEDRMKPGPGGGTTQPARGS